MRKAYIHYGSIEYCPDRFIEIKNTPYGMKPLGGLWGSPTDSDFGWKEWCDNSRLKECNIYNSFQFKLKEGANVYYIISDLDMRKLPRAKSPFDEIMGYSKIMYWLDFEQIKQMGYDAIDLTMSIDISSLCGWDCDSILVLNKYVIEAI